MSSVNRKPWRFFQCLPHRSAATRCFTGRKDFGQARRITPGVKIKYGVLDATFYRDDFRHHEKPLLAEETDIDFVIKGKNVILIDDVFYTGRTIRSALDALLDFGRPEKIELLVLIDRRLSRHVPITPDYVGKTIDAVTSEKVRVEWSENRNEDKVWIIPYKE